MFKRGIGIVAIITVLLCLGGCTMKSNNTNNTQTKDQNVVLTDQQKEILTKEEFTKLNEDFLMQHTISRIGAYVFISDKVWKTYDELMKFTTL